MDWLDGQGLGKSMIGEKHLRKKYVDGSLQMDKGCVDTCVLGECSP